MKRAINDPAQYTIDFDAAEELAAEPAERLSDTSRDIVYISLGSGSSGNSCYIGTARGGIIIDAGISDDLVEKALADNGISMNHVRALLLTHDHSDHIRYAYKILRNNRHMHLFCTNRVLNGLLRRHSISKRIKDYHVAIYKEIPFELLDFKVTAFEVPHDGSDNMGFSIELGDRRFVLATDMGEVSDRARHYMSQAQYLVIESNYDSDMLRLGRYPEYLKARIRARNGHMDNKSTAAFLQEIAGNGLQYIFLCHLSQDNNLPELALKASREALASIGLSVGDATDSIEDRRADIHLMALPRHEASRKFIFRP